VHIDVRGTAFQVEVWKALLSVGFGTTMSYQEVATSIGLPKAVRAVANAVGDNPVSLFIPCHRIVKSDGSLGGYLWGVAKKQSILDWENAHR
jgi:AraC family transcriptional regulator of adaptative response/methylated-DNA-[protein]-cysteine methyltransferase